jgi:hypothetical protein
MAMGRSQEFMRLRVLVVEVSSKPGPFQIKGSGTLRPLPRFIYAPPAQKLF